jgi:hypothetical protein
VYNTAQAERGQTVFRGSCAECHSTDLTGGKGPALKGDAFVKNWEAESVYRLLDKIVDSMPLGSPETLTDAVKLDVVAYILQANAYPTGPAELRLSTRELENIQIVRQGVTEVPNFALVQVVGCLVAAPDGRRWTLRQTTPPVLTKEAVATEAALKESGSKPLGSDTYSLLSITSFKPELHSGHKVEARGLVNRAAGESQLDVLSLQTVATTCVN